MIQSEAGRFCLEEVEVNFGPVFYSLVTVSLSPRPQSVSVEWGQ